MFEAVDARIDALQVIVLVHERRQAIGVLCGACQLESAPTVKVSRPKSKRKGLRGVRGPYKEIHIFVYPVELPLRTLIAVVISVVEDEVDSLGEVLDLPQLDQVVDIVRDLWGVGRIGVGPALLWKAVEDLLAALLSRSHDAPSSDVPDVPCLKAWFEVSLGATGLGHGGVPGWRRGARFSIAFVPTPTSRVLKQVSGTSNPFSSERTGSTLPPRVVVVGEQSWPAEGLLTIYEWPLYERVKVS